LRIAGLAAVATVIGVAGCGASGAKHASLAALDGKTGAVMWTGKTDALFLTTPAVVGNVVTVWADFETADGCPGDTRPVAFDRTTGRRVRSRATPLQPNLANTAVAHDLHIRAHERGLVIASNSTGRVVWRTRLPHGRFNIDPIPVFAGAGIVAAFPDSSGGLGMLYGDPKTSLIALDDRTGRVLWRLGPWGDAIVEPAFGPRTVYLFNDPHHLEALDPHTGHPRWHSRVDEGAITVSSRLVIAGPGRVSALSLGGRLLWSTKILKSTAPQPAADNGNDLYVPIEGASGSSCSD
jgi:outer membrane protein assembly factor BamB